MITRARSKQLEQQERDEKEKEVADGAQPKPADLGTEPITTSDIEEDGILGSSFDPDLFQAVKTRKGMTRSEKRTQRREFYEQKKKHHLDMGTEELKQLQQSDPSLASIREANHGEAEPNKTGILEEDGLLYRQWVPHGRETTGTIYRKAAADRARESGGQETQLKPGKTKIRCYNCHELGHIAAACPSKPAMYTEVVYMNDQNKTSSQEEDRFKKAGTVDGRRVTDILLDTGGARTGN